MSKHLGRQSSLLTGRNICQNQGQGGAAICCKSWGWRDKRHRVEESISVIFIVNGSQQTASSLGVAFAVCLFTLWSSVRSVLITDLATPLIGIFCFFSLDLILRVTVKSYQIQFEHLESTPDFFLICFNLSWNNKGTDHTWPKNCLWINCPITFEPLKIARIPKHLIR